MVLTLLNNHSLLTNVEWNNFLKGWAEHRICESGLWFCAQFLCLLTFHMSNLRLHRSPFRKFSVSGVCFYIPHSDTSFLWQLFCSALVLSSSFICSPSSHIKASHMQSSSETNRVAKHTSCQRHRAWHLGDEGGETQTKWCTSAG